MKEFIKGILTDTDGIPSSKRVVMFLLTFLFIGVSVINILYGKDLEQTLKNQLFYLLCWMFTVVFGEKVAKIWAPTIKSETKTTTPPKKDDTPQQPAEPPIQPPVIENNNNI